METFADYILQEKDYIKKMEIVYFLQKKEEHIFFNNSVILKTQIAKMFVEEMNIKVDENLLLTACLLYACKKDTNLQDFKTIKEIYGKEGAEYLRTLGFSDRFCRICEGHNRYTTPDDKREVESDILELVDEFGGMIMSRQDRPAFSVRDAIYLVENRNLAGKFNRYLETFKEFIRIQEDIDSDPEKPSPLARLGKVINLMQDEEIPECIRIINDYRLGEPIPSKTNNKFTIDHDSNKLGDFLED